jgi:REP element-mobilizing transposase RayT
MDRLRHGRRLRTGRTSLQGQVYLVTTVTIGRQRLFASFRTGRLVARELQRSDQYGATQTFAFVIMPDHLHWLFCLAGDRTLPGVMGAVKRHSARHVNVMLGRHGVPVWQHGYHDHALRSEEAIMDVARYVVTNPVRAGLVSHVGMYSLWDAVFVP